jgi:dTDP-4-dehydrorhamnose reductase
MALTYLVLGASGMLGNACLRALGENADRVFGTIRSPAAASLFPEHLRASLVSHVDAGDFDSVTRAIAEVRPDIVVNCIGMVKQLDDSKNPLVALPLNALFPHRLYQLCRVGDARLIHVSTDCVFSGEKGMYVEDDRPDADDLYGISKRLGEIDQLGAVTLRTSIIGHELASERSLIDWFLSQKGSTQGFTRAIYSGFPTVELARIIRDVVAPQPDLHGLFHVSSEPISKFDLLNLVSETYGKTVHIEPSERVVIDRSLDSTRFRDATGYTPPSWPELVRRMHEFG